MIWKWRSEPKDASDISGRFEEVHALKAPRRPCVLLRGGHCNSKIGGMPDGLSVEWPTFKDTPLSFLAQLDLSEIRQANGPDWLSSVGSLFFFYDAEHQPRGFDPADRGGWSVICQSPGESDVSPTNVPNLPSGSIFPEKRLCASVGECLPDANSEKIIVYFIDAYDTYREYFQRIFDDAEERYEGLPTHQVGGFPSPMQGGRMELQAQLVSNGLYCGNSSGYDDPRAKGLESGAKDWLLLLQLDSDDDVDMIWGGDWDYGRLYFWIREQDARRGDFSNVWLVRQPSEDA